MSRLSLSSFIAVHEAENGTELPDLARLLGGVVKRKIAKSGKNGFDDRKRLCASLSDLPQFVAALSKVAFEPASEMISRTSSNQSLTIQKLPLRSFWISLKERTNVTFGSDESTFGSA
jgi:hypothetical protein